MAGAILQLVLLGAIGWGLGNLVLDRFIAGEKLEPIGVAERALAATAGAVLFATAAMLAHIVTGGAIFGTRAGVPLLAVASLAATRRHFVGGGTVPWGKLAAAAVVLGVIYLAPAMAGGSSIRTGDPPWHLGWTEQLLDGEPVPTGPAPEFGRNAYPWGFHAVIATAVRLVPGSDPMVALEMLHVALMAALPLAAACLARRLRPDAGWAAAGAMSLIGGFGWIASRGPDFVASPSKSRYGADLVAASPNSVYELFPPALPRELGLVMLAAAAWFVACSVRSESTRLRFATGVSLGLVGLVSVPLFVTAVLWFVVAVFAVPRDRRLRWFATVGASSVLVFALWAGPVFSNALRYGGFVNITPQLGFEWSLPTAFASWGLLVPLAIGGIVLTLRSKGNKLFAGFAAATAVLLVAAVARGHFDWDLAGNATLFHQGRVWPPLHLLGAVFGGVALAWLYERLRGKRRWLGAAVTAVILVVGAASPVLASRKLADIIQRNTAGFEYARPDLAPGSFARRAARYLDASELLEVRGDDKLAFTLFQLSGVRLTNYDDPRLDGNDLRIRYADLANAHDAKAVADAFDPTFLIVPAPEDPYRRALERGTFNGEEWILIQLNE